MYSGSSPVSGYFVDFKEEDSGEWKTTSEAATPNRYLKVRVCRVFDSVANWPEVSGRASLDTMETTIIQSRSRKLQ